jgi:hypothetical protein
MEIWIPAPGVIRELLVYLESRVVTVMVTVCCETPGGIMRGETVREESKPGVKASKLGSTFCERSKSVWTIPPFAGRLDHVIVPGAEPLTNAAGGRVVEMEIVGLVNALG